jgi:hypothetical protein
MCIVTHWVDMQFIRQLQEDRDKWMDRFYDIRGKYYLARGKNG